MIDGVVIKKVVRHTSNDGFFAELVKSGEETFHDILQTSYSETEPGVIKAFHIHNYWESWTVVKGHAKVVLYDMRPKSKTYGQTQKILTGEDKLLVITIPADVAHGYQVLGDTPMGIIYLASEAYDPKNPSIKELPFDDSRINFNWTKP